MFSTREDGTLSHFTEGETEAQRVQMTWSHTAMECQGEDGTGQLGSGGLLVCPARSRGWGALSCPSLLSCPRPGPSRACLRGFSLSIHPCKLTITPIAENQQITLLGLLPSQEILGPHTDLCVAALGSQRSPAGSRLPAFAHTRSLRSAHPPPRELPPPGSHPDCSSNHSVCVTQPREGLS